MKFLCDNCKAKYQIADDKVVGKTVRMKCRKCGHNIEVRAAVTESSVSSPPPADPAARKGALATSFSTAKPAPPRAPVSSPPSSAPPSALGAAFQRSVEAQLSEAPVALDARDISVTDEWYVAINGVPVGPVRISELRRKAASGAVTEDSLVWQEGLEEWRPVKTITELAQIVREAASAGRPSLTAPRPPERTSAVPPAPAPLGSLVAPLARPAPLSASPAPPPARPSAIAPRPADPMAMAARSNNVVPITSRLATAEKMEPAFSQPPVAPLPATPPPPTASAAPPAVVPLAPMQLPQVDPFAGMRSSINPADPFAAQRLSAAPDPFAAPPMGQPNAGMSAQFAAQHPSMMMSASPSLVPPMPAKRGAPWWFILVAVFVGCFGAAVAVLLFMQRQQPVVIQVPPPATASASAGPVASSSATPDSSGAIATSDSAAPSASAGGPKIAMAGHGNTGAASTASGGKSAADLSSLLGGTGPGGPNVGTGTSSGGGNTGGGTLDSAAVQRVVSSHGPGVKRTCWERGGADQKSSANITVSIQVAGNGSVSGASASGDDPVIAKCIENQVRLWSFPAPGAQTTVNVPFHFVRQ